MGWRLAHRRRRRGHRPGRRRRRRRSRGRHLQILDDPRLRHQFLGQCGSQKCEMDVVCGNARSHAAASNGDTPSGSWSRITSADRPAEAAAASSMFISKTTFAAALDNISVPSTSERPAMVRSWADRSAVQKRVGHNEFDSRANRRCARMSGGGRTMHSRKSLRLLGAVPATTHYGGAVPRDLCAPTMLAFVMSRTEATARRMS